MHSGHRIWSWRVRRNITHKRVVLHENVLFGELNFFFFLVGRKMFYGLANNHLLSFVSLYVFVMYKEHIRHIKYLDYTSCTALKSTFIWTNWIVSESKKNIHFWRYICQGELNLGKVIFGGVLIHPFYILRLIKQKILRFVQQTLLYFNIIKGIWLILRRVMRSIVIF